MRGEVTQRGSVLVYAWLSRYSRSMGVTICRVCETSFLSTLAMDFATDALAFHSGGNLGFSAEANSYK